MEHIPEGHPDHCQLCRNRAGLPVPEAVIEYEKPMKRAWAHCQCEHCRYWTWPTLCAIVCWWACALPRDPS